MNVNESISVFETALCEMRPETLETDLKGNNNNNNTSSSNYATLLDTFRPYVSVMSIDESQMLAAAEGTAADGMLSMTEHQTNTTAESSFMNYQNYLYPQASTPERIRPGQTRHRVTQHLRLSDEESTSTNNTASMQTNTTESTVSSNLQDVRTK